MSATAASEQKMAYSILQKKLYTTCKMIHYEVSPLSDCASIYIENKILVVFTLNMCRLRRMYNPTIYFHSCTFSCRIISFLYSHVRGMNDAHFDQERIPLVCDPCSHSSDTISLIPQPHVRGSKEDDDGQVVMDL